MYVSGREHKQLCNKAHQFTGKDNEYRMLLQDTSSSKRHKEFIFAFTESEDDSVKVGTFTLYTYYTLSIIACQVYHHHLSWNHKALTVLKLQQKVVSN